MKKLFSMVAVLTAFVMVAVSCNDTNPPEQEKIPVTEVKITPAVGSVVAGETTTLQAQVLPENATDKTVTWGSRDTDVATVDQSGVVTGVKEGEVEIWAKAGDKTGKATITVTAAPIRVKTVTLNKTELALFVSKSEKLTYTIDPVNATNQEAVWDSSNKTVATVADDGTVSALAEGTSNITLTIDEKTATCVVTVSIPEIESISTPYLKDLSDNTVQMTAAGFRAGDKVRLEDFFGFATATDIDVKNVTATGAAFDLPGNAPKDRSLKLTVIRDNKAICVDYIRYDDDMVQMAAGLGYVLTAANEVVEDGSIPNLHGSVARQGYVTPAAVFQYNETDGTFDASAADLKKATFASENGEFVVTYLNGVKDFTGMEHFDLSEIHTIRASDTRIEELDMTLFPNCTQLLAWGDPGLGDGRFKKVNFGKAGVDTPSKLTHVQLERNQITGPVDVTNCPDLYNKLDLSSNQITGSIDLTKCTKLKEFNIANNQVEEIKLGTAEGKAATDPDMLAIYSINAVNNKLKEFDISNCGRIRVLLLEGNKIERIRLLNNVVNAAQHSPDPDGDFPYMYILKSPDTFSITWATAAEAESRERVVDVEYYWWRKFSANNQKENTDNKLPNFDGGWVENGPVVKALAAGFKVNCWSYVKESTWYPVAAGANIIHSHEGGATPCAYFD